MSCCDVHTMRDILICIFFFAVCVGMYLSQELNTPTTVVPYTEAYDDSPTIAYEDYDSPLVTDSPDRCFSPNLECVSSLKTVMPVCGYKKKMGLNNYISLCEIKLQNCMLRPLYDLVPYGEISKHDIIYYNGQGRDCYFYMRQSANLDEAIKLYHALGGSKDQHKGVKEPYDKVNATIL